MLEFVGIAIEATILKIDDIKNQVEFDVEIKCHWEVPNKYYGETLRYMNKEEIQSLVEPDIKFYNTDGPWIEISKPVYLCKDKYAIVDYNWKVTTIQDFNLMNFPFDEQDIYLSFVIQNTKELVEFWWDLVENRFDRLIVRNKDFNYSLINGIKSETFLSNDSLLICGKYYIKISFQRMINCNIYNILFLNFFLIFISFYIKVISNLEIRILFEILLFMSLIIINNCKCRIFTLYDKIILISYSIIFLNIIKNIFLKKNYDNNLKMVEIFDTILFSISFIIFMSSYIMLFIMNKDSVKKRIFSNNDIQRFSSFSVFYDEC